ncbi:hypothetical protein IAD21_05533 [Abditibacteriota bacterium]|nr:hypothetical protein IAD21_05533 [Abditibacteriota bacterium]
MMCSPLKQVGDLAGKGAPVAQMREPGRGMTLKMGDDGFVTVQAKHVPAQFNGEGFFVRQSGIKTAASRALVGPRQAQRLDLFAHPHIRSLRK